MQQVREWIAAADRIVAMTGAGVSAESGIPTFRSADGLWRKYRAEDLATPSAFERDPKLVWEWYQWRRGIIAHAGPNPAHHALAALEARKPSFLLITQNVDGLHDRAGSVRLLKLHGDIWTVRCLGCGRETHDERLEFPETPPHCECGGMLRPGVVWFGEPLPSRIWEEAEKAVRASQVFLVIGTSAVVHPAAGLVRFARRSGAKVIEVNPESTPATRSAHESFRGFAGEILPALLS